MIHASYQQRIMLDRYAIKDPHAVPKTGDLVIVSMTRSFSLDGEEIPSRELGRVQKVSNGTGPARFTVELEDEVVEGLERHCVEVLKETTPEEIHWRLANAIAKAEIVDADALSWNDVDNLLSQDPLPIELDRACAFRDQVFTSLRHNEFVPAGRIQAGLGQEDLNLTLFNCYVLPRPGDSRGGITKRWGEMFEIFSRGGGIGFDASSMRNAGAVVTKVRGRSSGAVSWLEQWSQITGAVEQGGSRRGATLFGLKVWHPDIERFITVKSEQESFDMRGDEVFKALDKEALLHRLTTNPIKGVSVDDMMDYIGKVFSGGLKMATIKRDKDLIANANISVLITDDFMEAVENDTDWDLEFPDTSYPDYDDTWNGDLREWKAAGKPTRIVKTVKAKDVWDRLIDRAWASGEPGVLFVDRMNKMSNSWYYGKIECTNPCGEQSLPANSVCNLGHLNLAMFMRPDVEHFPKTPRTAEEAIEAFDAERFAQRVAVAVRFLDDIIDLENFVTVEVQERQLGERRIGLGILGYGELMVRLGLRYGSDEAIKFSDWLFREFAVHSYMTSVELAKEKGAFPLFDATKYLQSGFMQGMPEQVRSAVQQHGIRNVCLNTIAPTGSVGTALGTTTGIETYLALEWLARSRIGEAKEEANALSEIKDKFGDDKTAWPDYFVTIAEITPTDHVRTQAAAQRWIDSSISKTVNLPKHATREDVSEAYWQMYKMGCKGGTVYRDRSRTRQVLYSMDDEPVVEEVTPEQLHLRAPNTSLRPRLTAGYGPIISQMTPVGRIHVSIRHDADTHEPYDVFITSGKGDIGADVQAMGRLISLILRWPDNADVPQKARLEMVRNQLQGIVGRQMHKNALGPEVILSLPDGIATSIRRYLEGDYPMPPSAAPSDQELQEQLIEIHSRLQAARRQVLENQIVMEQFKAALETDSMDDLLKVTAAVDALALTQAFKRDAPSNGSNGHAPNRFVEAVPQVQVASSEDDFSIPYDICPECGAAALYSVPGKCADCKNCGHSAC